MRKKTFYYSHGNTTASNNCHKQMISLATISSVTYHIRRIARANSEFFRVKSLFRKIREEKCHLKLVVRKIVAKMTSTKLAHFDASFPRFDDSLIMRPFSLKCQLIVANR